MMFWLRCCFSCCLGLGFSFVILFVLTLCVFDVCLIMFVVGLFWFGICVFR